MPDKKKKEKVNTQAGMTALTASGKETNKGEKDGRMRGARQKSLNEDIKKAGGRDKYINSLKEKKSNMVKYGNKYYKKDSPTGKAILKKKK